MIRRTNPPHAHTILIAILDLLKARELPSGQDLLSPLKVRMRKGLPIYPSVGTIRANSYWVPEAKRKPLEETRKKLKVPLFIPLPALEMVKTSSGHCKGLLTARNEGRLFATLQFATQRLNQTTIGVVLPCCATARRPRFFRSCF